MKQESAKLGETSYVYFALKGDNFNPDHITNTLGISPTKSFKNGDRRSYGNDTLEFSAWHLHSDKVDNLFVSNLVSDVVNKLFDKIHLINQLKEEFQLESVLEIVLYIDENIDISTPVIGHDLKTIEFLFKTNTETDVDICRFDSSV